MIITKKVTSKKDLKNFIKFPFKLYKNSKYWVPPIIKAEMEIFNTQTNPVFNDAEVTLFLAYKDTVIVGRIAAIINHLEVKKSEKKVRFGWFDAVDDIAVTEALIAEVNAFGKRHQLKYIEGPMGFSNLDKVGLLTEGFNHIGSIATWYNYPYYVTHLNQLGFTEEKEYQENKFSKDDIDHSKFMMLQDVIKKRYQLRTLSFKSVKDIMPYTDEMFDLFNRTYSKLSTFVEITDQQKSYLKKKFIAFINPEYVSFIVDKDEKMIAFAIVMPSYAKAFQKANGKLFPFGFLHILQAKKYSKTAVMYLIGIDEKYQNKGVTALIFGQLDTIFKKKKITNFIRLPELVDNLASVQMWKHFKDTTYKRRKTFKKNIS